MAPPVAPVRVLVAPPVAVLVAPALVAVLVLAALALVVGWWRPTGLVRVWWCVGGGG